MTEEKHECDTCYFLRSARVHFPRYKCLAAGTAPGVAPNLDYVELQQKEKPPGKSCKYWRPKTTMDVRD